MHLQSSKKYAVPREAEQAAARPRRRRSARLPRSSAAAPISCWAPRGKRFCRDVCATNTHSLPRNDALVRVDARACIQCYPKKWRAVTATVLSMQAMTVSEGGGRGRVRIPQGGTKNEKRLWFLAERGLDFFIFFSLVGDRSPPTQHPRDVGGRCQHDGIHPAANSLARQRCSSCWQYIPDDVYWPGGHGRDILRYLKRSAMKACYECR